MAEMQIRSRDPHSSFSLWADRCIDCIVTLICWAWFTLGFILFFSWRYIAYALIVKDPELAFQRLNCKFYRIFFQLVRLTAPRHRLEIADEVAAIRSAVIVCNHLSYLDPLLLISIFERQRTIVKTRFFSMPIFGWIISRAGYLPATSEGGLAKLTVRQLETMGAYLEGGGNLFVFPEGTRSRNGKIGKLNTGAFKIARMYKAPIYVLEIRNTDTLFTPGKFLFNTRIKNTISVEIIDRIMPDYQHHQPSIADLERQVSQAFMARQR